MKCSAGDIFEFRRSGKGSKLENRKRAEFLADALSRMDYDAIALGEKDLFFGRDFLQQMQEKYQLPFVCANAVDRTTHEPIFDPYVIRDAAGVRVAFLGIVSPNRHVTGKVESALQKEEIEILDPVRTSLEYLPQMRENADLVVLLSHAGIETTEFLAEDLPVDVAVVGHYPAIASSPRKLGETVLVMAGARSERFGTLELTLSEQGTIREFDGDAIRLLKEGPLDEGVLELEEAWDKHHEDTRQALRLARERQREKKEQQEFAKTIREHRGIYGAESCRTCHEPVYESWLVTPHATAFATLTEADEWDNPDCIGCHVTGITEKHEVEDVNIPKALHNVQCEECHGSGLDHARDGTYVTAGEATCRKCHDADNSPAFDFAIYSEYGIH